MTIIKRKTIMPIVKSNVAKEAICALALLLSSKAHGAGNPINDDVTIEHGFDLLTVTARQDDYETLRYELESYGYSLDLVK